MTRNPNPVAYLAESFLEAWISLSEKFRTCAMKIKYHSRTITTCTRSTRAITLSKALRGLVCFTTLAHRQASSARTRYENISRRFSAAQR
eukprot:4347807-Pyramimonas_sp.AAC.1